MKKEKNQISDDRSDRPAAIDDGMESANWRTRPAMPTTRPSIAIARPIGQAAGAQFADPFQFALGQIQRRARFSDLRRNHPDLFRSAAAAKIIPLRLGLTHLALCLQQLLLLQLAVQGEQGCAGDDRRAAWQRQFGQASGYRCGNVGVICFQVALVAVRRLGLAAGQRQQAHHCPHPGGPARHHDRLHCLSPAGARSARKLKSSQHSR